MSEFSYPNSDHVRDDAPANVTKTDEPGEPRTFAYEKMAAQDNPVQGAPAEKLPEAVKALREGDDARRVFGAQKTFAQALPIDESTPDEMRPVIAELREVMADIGASAAEARVFADLAQRDPASDETRSAWEAEALAQLREQYHDGADEALADARKLVARDPRFAQLLNATGWGSNPRVVAIMVEKARSERARGRL